MLSASLNKTFLSRIDMRVYADRIQLSAHAPYPDLNIDIYSKYNHVPRHVTCDFLARPLPAKCLAHHVGHVDGMGTVLHVTFVVFKN